MENFKVGDKVEYVGPYGYYYVFCKDVTPIKNKPYTVSWSGLGRFHEDGVSSGEIKKTICVEEIDLPQDYSFFSEHFRKLQTIEDFIERMEVSENELVTI